MLARIKDGALLVNVSRGPVVAHRRLVAELESGRISAALDVVDPEPLPEDHPLWRAPNLLLSPHVGGNSDAMDARGYTPRPRAAPAVRRRRAARERGDRRLLSARTSYELVAMATTFV